MIREVKIYKNVKMNVHHIDIKNLEIGKNQYTDGKYVEIDEHYKKING